MADPLKEISNSNIQIVYETNDEDIEIGTHTTQNGQNKWTKILTLATTIFCL